MGELQHEYIKIIKELDNAVNKMIPYQVMDKERPDYGGYFSEELGFASPYHVGNARYLTCLGYAYFTPQSVFFEDNDILQRILLSIEFKKNAGGLQVFLISHLQTLILLPIQHFHLHH